MNGGTIVAESFCVRNSGTFTMNGGAIRGNDSLSVGVVNHGQMYANGGTVKDCAQFVLDNYGTVLVDAQASGTEFDGDASNGGPCAATIFGGIFHGNVSNEEDGAISGGTFDGVVVNRRGTINNGIFNDVVLNYSDGEIQGTFQAGIITGKGTAEDPYRISNAAQLKWFRNTVNSENCSICAALTADIDLENDPWTPIGTDFQNSYTGTFDGKGHTVKNLFINSGSLQYAGLFGYTKAAALRDLTVSGSVTSTAEDNSVGGIVGMVYGGVIENCGNLCKVIGKHTGGIAGRI